MFSTFRLIALLEGITTLALFLVAMPMKYILGNPALIRPIGSVHGIAFLIYIAAMIVLFSRHRLPLGAWVRTTVASFFPFGTFLNDAFLKRLEAHLQGHPLPPR